MSRAGRPRALRVASFVGWYVGQFVRANLDVVREVVTPGTGVAPAVVRHRLRCRTDVETASFVALVGLTPGTLVVGTHEEDEPGPSSRRRRPAGTRGVVGAHAGERTEIAVHVMHAPDAAAAAAELAELEDRMLEAFRRRGRGRAARRPSAGGDAA